MSGKFTSPDFGSSLFIISGKMQHKKQAQTMGDASTIVFFLCKPSYVRNLPWSWGSAGCLLSRSKLPYDVRMQMRDFEAVNWS